MGNSRDILKNWPDPYLKKSCSRCVYDSETPGIVFDENGVCNFCHTHDQFDREYPVGKEGERRLEMMADEIKRAGKGKPFDCIVGVSGGCDSSYLIHKAKELGLRPLAAHFDNTWNSAIATENIRRLLQKTNVELFTIVANNKEYDDIYSSFIKAGVADVEAPTDIALAVTHYKAAEKYGIKYILEGHSFRTEGISPLGWLYMDGKYVESVHAQFGKVKMKTYPRMPLHHFLKWTAFSGIKKLRPLYYMDYHKEEAKKFLTDTYGWQWYGGHHLENRFTAFYHTYILPRRLGIDTRVLGFAALARSNQMTREEGLKLMEKPASIDPEQVKYVKTRLGYSDEEFEAYMTAPLKTYRDYKTYRETFIRLKPLFWALYKMDKIPKSFYMKFTRRD